MGHFEYFSNNLPKQSQKGLSLYVFTYFQGCYRLVMNFILDNATKIGVAVLSAAVIHITGVVLTCLLARSISKANYEEIS